MDVCLQRLPVTFLMDRAGLSEDGVTHHGIYGPSYLSQMPGMTVLCASSRAELRAMMRYALRADGPVAIRYNKSDLSGTDDSAEPPVYHPVWQRCREGGDIALLASGAILHECLEAADILQKQGVGCAVWNASCLYPLDMKALHAIRLPIVTVEESALNGGFGSLVNMALAQEGLPAPALMLGLSGLCSTQGERKKQLRANGLDAASIAESMLRWRKKH